MNWLICLKGSISKWTSFSSSIAALRSLSKNKPVASTVQEDDEEFDDLGEEGKTYMYSYIP